MYRNLWYKGRSRNRNCQCAKIYATAIKLTQTSFSTVVMKLSSTFISGHCLQSLAKRSFFILLLSNTTYNPWLLWFSSTGSFTHCTVILVLKGEELCPLGPWSFHKSSEGFEVQEATWCGWLCGVVAGVVAASVFYTYSIHWSIWARKFVEIIQLDYLPLA